MSLALLRSAGRRRRILPRRRRRSLAQQRCCAVLVGVLWLLVSSETTSECATRGGWFTHGFAVQRASTTITHGTVTSSSSSRSTTTTTTELFAIAKNDRQQSFSSSSSDASSPAAPFSSAASSDDDDNDESEDEDGRNNSSGGLQSPFGLRKKVKSVLRKAKNRTTGRRSRWTNGDSNSAATVVADTASIGGFERNTADFDFAPPRELGRFTTDDNSRSGGPVPTLRLRSALTSSSSSDVVSGEDAYPGGVDALLNDADTTAPLAPEPLPFVLPTLTPEQEQCLMRGERVQEQSKMGREGSGFVVMDIAAPPYVVWECLLDFEAYPQNIGTVKRMTMFTNTHLKSSYIAEQPVVPGTGRETRHYGTASITRASFVLSKFHLNIAAIHQYRPHPDGHYMVFTLDRACKNVVMQDAKGIWYTQTVHHPPGDGGSSTTTTKSAPYTRVWLLCEIKVSALLPSFIVDYAAKRAMPRATTWLPPVAERLAQQWLLSEPNNSTVAPV